MPESLAPGERAPFDWKRINPLRALARLAGKEDIRGIVGVFALVIVMPLLGSAILGAVSHLPPGDARIGSSFFLSAAMQALAVLAALRYFRRASQSEAV